MEEPTTPNRNMITVRSSVNLAGLPRGEWAFVDANDPEIAKLIADLILVPRGDVPAPEVADQEILDDSPQAAA